MKPALLTKDRCIQEKTFHILSSYKTNISSSYRISTQMPTEWPKMAEWPSGVTRRMLNHIKAVAARRCYRMGELMLRGVSEGEYRG
jgi:hypothetical protein